MLLIYTPQTTNRINYTFDLFFRVVLKTSYRVTTDVSEFLIYKDAKFSYSKEPLADELFFKQSDLLLETTILPQQIICEEATIGNFNLKGFFKTENAAFSFDVFASAFYLVSRYEEYLSKETDMHGRFKATDSKAFCFDFLQEPMIDYYALAVRELLLSKFSDEKIETKGFEKTSTFDIDLAYQYLHKSWRITLGGFARDLLKGDVNGVKKRARVLLELQPDPFYSFEFIEKQNERYEIPYIFFWQIGNREGKYDKNISHTVPEFQKLIKKFADKSGIHLSYSSHAKEDGYKKEIARLSDIISKEVKRNRFHYLKMKVGESYRKLMDAGITEDYTMGYPYHEGFRASIARPFYWYDLEKEERTNLLVVPFMFMDSPMRHKHFPADEVKMRIQKMILRTKEVGGTLVSLWHNDTFSETNPNWKEIFEWFNKAVND